MDRSARQPDREKRDDRDHKARYDRNSRSRSPAPRERRDDRRRDRSPYRPPGARGGRGGAAAGAGRDHDSARGRGRDSPPPPRGPGTRGRGGGQYNNRAHDSRGNYNPKAAGARHPQPVVKMEPLEDEDEEAFMKRILGFGGFRSTKNTKVPGNDKNYAVHKVKKTEYRQYMNRVGGFNRPLSPTRL